MKKCQTKNMQIRPGKRGVGLIIAMAPLLATVMTGCGGDEAGGAATPQRRIPVVQVATVATDRMERAINLTGEVIPIESIQISAMVEGPITYCPWREGDQVEAGQKLIEIDREMYRAEAQAAQAALEVAQAKLADLQAGTRPEEIEKARQGVLEAEQSASFEDGDFERIVQLVETGALPREDLEKAIVKRTAAEARLAAARQQLEMLEAGYTPTAIAVQEAVVKEADAKLELTRAKLRECVISAPFDGAITRVFARRGDMAAVRNPLLQMADLDSLIIRCAVPEAQAGIVRKGMQAQARLDALPGMVLAAQVSRVFPELDARMRTRTIELEIQEEADIAVGMFGHIRLILEAVEDAVVVPAQAILVTQGEQQIAFVTSDGKAIRRVVQTGIEADGRVQILSGLAPGEQIIIAGQERLRDGAEIRIPGPPANGQAPGATADTGGASS